MEDMILKRALTEALVLILAATMVGTAANLLRPEARKLAWIGKYATPSVSQKSPSAAPLSRPESAIAPPADPRAIAPPKDPGLLSSAIPGDVARRLHAAGALFIDARRSSAYEEGHIARARSIAVWEHDADAKVAALQREEKLPFDTVIVIYCSGTNCKDSEMLAEKLAMAGFLNLYVYQAGFPDWESSGGPTKRGRIP